MPNVQRTISVDDFERESEGELTFVAITGGIVRGYISIWEPEWFVHHLYVDPSASGAGIGRVLLEHTWELASPQPLRLKCQTANTNAISFYRYLRFVDSAELGTDDFGDWIGLVRYPI